MQNIASFIENADPRELKLMLSAVEKKLKIAASPLSDDEAPPRALDRESLDILTHSIKAWQNAAAAPAQRRSRSRIWLAFLLFRYGALRLGEVLALDDRNDFDFETGKVMVQGQAPRSVQMPDDVMNAIKSLLQEPMFYSLRGEVLRIDPGYLRRKFYEQADLAGLARELVSPRVLRHSRGVELLNGGVPAGAVQFFMGVQSRGAEQGFGEISPLTGQRIVQQYLNKEVKMKTSARNLFMGTVSRIARDGLLAEVELKTLSGLTVVAMITEESFENLRIAEGGVVTASIKAPWVVLAVPEPGERLKTSARNQFDGKVAEVKQGKLASEVLVDIYEGSKVCALVTGESVERLGLAPGKDITVMFKAFSVILSAD